MSTVHTARGPVDSTELGRTYMHEHVFVLTPDVQQNFPELWGDEDTRVADAVAKATAELGASGRVLLRPSGTEQLVRVMVEAADEYTAHRLGEQLADVVRERLAL